MKTNASILGLGRSALLLVGLPLVASAMLAGCRCVKSPYDYAQNWLIREDPIRPFAIHADLIYLQGSLFLDMKELSHMDAYAKAEVGRGRFSGIARVFAPLVADEVDVERALKWYFQHHHEKGRPVVFIGEGTGGALLKAYEEKNADWLKKNGLVASFYTEESRKGFVTDAMVREIKHAIAGEKYRAEWGKEMPDGMLKD